MSNPRCPDPLRCELVGCEHPAICRPQAVARTPAPIPLAPIPAAPPEASLAGWFRGMFRPGDKDINMLAEDPLMANLEPPVPIEPAPRPSSRPASQLAPVLIVPVRAGGFAMLIGEPPNREMLAVALDAAGLADVVRRWASGEIS